MKKHWEQFAPLIFMGIIALLVVSVVYYWLSVLSPSGADFTAEDPASIAKYKEWIRYNDAPLAGGKIKPDELPGVYRKVIEFDIKTGNLKSARDLINETIQRRLDAQVLTLAQLPETKELFGQLQNARQKVAVLKELVALVNKKTDKSGGDAELARLADKFGKILFDPSA